MPRCIYCQQERPAKFYAKAEHVLPQSFGKFRQNMTLHKVVCDWCNQYFGDNLEIYLARDSFEGQLRFKHGVKGANQFKPVSRERRIVVKSKEGELAGCYMERSYSEYTNDIAIKPLPQVGFRLAPDNKYSFFLLDRIPTKLELEERGFQDTHPRSILGLEVDHDELTKRLAEKGISFCERGSYEPESSAEAIECELECKIDHTIFRAIAKIAFNYLAFWEGADFVQHSAFDKVRRYIRWQHHPGYKLIDVDEESILVDEPIEGERRLGHLITMNWAEDRVSVLAQVSLLNWLTYRVSLAQDFTGPPPELTRGHFFSVSNQEILELGSRPSGR